ncbi:filamentous hemagglutinin [Duganella sacchari]|uniref:Filamentous hemagglutinin n=2 Tax=Duganella sacchari TaxID=551987 RepID=A0A1M7P969_9BURK|nr:filamentous hemagglutinin [Duganella sacchari]
MKQFREIIRAPGEFQEKVYDGLKFLEKRLEDGRGVRLNMDSTFKGFID